MKKFLKVTAWIVVILLVIVFGGGLLLSPEWSVTRSRVIAAPPEAIHAYVGDLAMWTAWSPFEKEDPQMLISVSEPSSGVGANRSWKSDKMGNGKQTVVKSDPAKGMTFSLEFEGFPAFEGEFVYEPVSGGTNVTWTDRGNVGGSPLRRWMAKMLEAMMGSSFEEGLASLDAVVTAKK